MPGCRLLVTPDAVTQFPLQQGFGGWPLSIPNFAGLIGGVIYQQAFVFEWGANPFNAIVTHGARIRVGGR